MAIRRPAHRLAMSGGCGPGRPASPAVNESGSVTAGTHVVAASAMNTIVIISPFAKGGE